MTEFGKKMNAHGVIPAIFNIGEEEIAKQIERYLRESPDGTKDPQRLRAEAVNQIILDRMMKEKGYII